MNYTNPLDNTSYINKDFQTIYPELLDLVKKLSYKWDPTISNESDPGVILIKLNALLADKNNYNIDKNILECFPETVTQEGNARNIYYQLGYNMHWYVAPEGEISVALLQEGIAESNRTLSVYIPKFTMFCNEDKDIVFTSTKATYCKFDDSYQKVPVLQGIVRDYEVAGQKVIHLKNLDSENRLYFPVNNVAENGVFIQNIDIKDAEDFPSSSEWAQVDNLQITPSGKKAYFFGFDNKTNSCYIEFPSDISSLIGNGLYIKYIQTQGEEGNIPARMITSFYSESKVISADNKTEISIGKESIEITNNSSIKNGKNPETIDEAYVGYKRTIGTFDTLVTIRDYINYITDPNYRIASNAVISDRTNDIQSSYKIVSTRKGNTSIIPVVTNDEMTAFSLKDYTLEWVEFPEDRYSYDKSFDLQLSEENNLNTSKKVLNHIQGTKCIQHDFISKLSGKPLFFKNKYDLDITVIPQYSITDSEAREIQLNIEKNLYRNLCSKEVSFGKEISYDQVYDICVNADSRIKAIAMDNIDYKTFAVIYNDNKNELEEVDITTSLDTDKEPIEKEVIAKSVLAGVTPLCRKDIDFGMSLETEVYLQNEEIESISSKCDIEITDIDNTGKSYELKENEKILLYAPNLIEKSNYSMGVKYSYWRNEEPKSDKNISANTDYKLDGTDNLVLYWKREDSEDAPYYYKFFNTGDIINVNFKLTQDEDDEVTSVGRSLQRGTEGELYDSNQNDIISGIQSRILSATKKLSLKAINSATLDNPVNYCYWITNLTEEKNGKKYNILEFKYIKDTSDENYSIYEYQLRSGEYFIYTDSTKSDFFCLENGTKIQLEINKYVNPSPYTYRWEVPALNTNINEQGIADFNSDSWYTFINDESNRNVITATENQMIMLGEGSEIIVQSKDGNVGYMRICSDGIRLDNYEYAAISQNPFENFRVAYKDIDSNSPTYLPNTTDDISWNGYSILSVNSSKDYPQLIRANHKITFYDGNGTEIATITGEESGVYLQTDPPLSLMGGDKMDVVSININNERIPLSAFVYSKTIISIDNSNFDVVREGNKITVTLLSDLGENQTIKLPLQILKSYCCIVPIEINKITNNSLKVSAINAEENTWSILNSDDGECNSEKTYYLKILEQSGGTKGIEIQFEIPTGTKKGLSFTIHEVLCYSNKEYVESLLDSIKALDTDGYFDYTYQVNEDSISDPAVAKSFFDINHIFNSYTIPQINKMKIKVMTKKG